jgi:hypothetical protein
MMVKGTAFALLLCLGSALGQDNSLPVSVSPQPGTLSQAQIQQLLRTVADNDIENDKKLLNYTYIERGIEDKLDGKGAVKSSESKTYEILEIYNEPVRRLIAKDDKPISDKDAAKEEEKIQKIIDKRKNESEEDRQKRIKDEEKEVEQNRQFEKEVADAYDFKLLGVEPIEGRDAYVIAAEPRPGFQPHLKDARILPKFRFKAWIDKDELQWARLEAECIDTVSFGVFLARIHKGSRLELEQIRINNEVWLPKHVSVKFDARIALMKELAENLDFTYRDYKKFRTASRILPLAEDQNPHPAGSSEQ